MKLLEIISILKSAPADSEEFKGALEELSEGYWASRFMDNPFLLLSEAISQAFSDQNEDAQAANEHLEKIQARIKKIQEFELPEIEEGGSDDDT